MHIYILCMFWVVFLTLTRVYPLFIEHGHCLFWTWSEKEINSIKGNIFFLSFWNLVILFSVVGIFVYSAWPAKPSVLPLFVYSCHSDKIIGDQLLVISIAVSLEGNGGSFKYHIHLYKAGTSYISKDEFKHHKMSIIACFLQNSTEMVTNAKETTVLQSKSSTFLLF